jgi:hypothetical protein
VSNVAPPIVIDLGRLDRDEVRLLREDNGRLRDDVEDVMRLVRDKLGTDGGDRLLVAVVAVYFEPSSF